MAWTAPDTWTSNQVITAAALNRMRDNFNETAVAKATTAGSHFVGTGVNSIAERLTTGTSVDTSETSNSTSYTNLATNGPEVTVTTGVQVLSWMNCSMSNSTANIGTFASMEITGATTTVAADSRGLYLQSAAGNDMRAGVCALQTTTPGTNTFRMQYKVTANTGTWLRRRLIIMPL